MRKEDTNKSVKIFGVSYELKVIYKRVKAPKLNLQKKLIEISLPTKYKKLNNEILIEMLLEKMYDAIASKELDIIMEKVRTTLKFAPEDYKIMRLDKRLAKCLANRIIINYNPYLLTKGINLFEGNYLEKELQLEKVVKEEEGIIQIWYKVKEK